MLNNFYTDVPDEFLCLELDTAERGILFTPGARRWRMPRAGTGRRVASEGLEETPREASSYPFNPSAFAVIML